MAPRKCCRCVKLRDVSMASAVLSVVYSMSSVTAALNGMIYGDMSASRQYLLINGLISLFAAITCLHGIVKESPYYLIPWIFVSAVTVVFGSVLSMSYLSFGDEYYVILGSFFFVGSVVLFAGWICVFAYFYELCDDSSRGEPRRPPTTRTLGRTRRDSSYPPAYNVAYAPETVDKPPSYEEVTQPEANGRF